MIPGRPAASHFTGSSRCFLCSRWIVPACAQAGIGSYEGLRRACRDGGAEGACRRGVVSGASWRPERSDLKRSRHVSPRTFASRTAAQRVSSMCARQCAGKQRRATSEGQHVLLVPRAPTSSIMHCSSSATPAPSACASSSSCRRRFISKWIRFPNLASESAATRVLYRRTVARWQRPTSRGRAADDD